MNVYKPRYKIAYQTQSKIWPYKDSRLRRFFNIRGRKLVRQGFFKRIVLVFNNMKWTIARRYIRPYMRRRKAVRRRFRNAFYNKQQLRAYFGQIQEEKFRNFFKKYVTSGTLRNSSFFTVLERRLDVFFFRARLLPTIFACHQYILHRGILINEGKKHSPSILVRPGDVLTIPVEHWQAFHFYLMERITYRCHGKYRWLKRKYMKLKKKSWAMRSILRGNFLMFYIWQKRRALDTFLIVRKKEFLLILTKLINKYIKIKKISWDHFGYLNCRQLFLSFKKFIFLEKIRRKFFYLQWLKFKLKFKKKVHKFFTKKKTSKQDLDEITQSKLSSINIKEDQKLNVFLNSNQQIKKQYKKYKLIGWKTIKNKIQSKRYNFDNKKIILNKVSAKVQMFAAKTQKLEFNKILNNKQFKKIIQKLVQQKVQNLTYNTETKIKVIIVYLIYILFLYFPKLIKHISYNKRIHVKILATLLKMDIWFLKILRETGNIKFKKYFFTVYNTQLFDIYKKKWDKFLNNTISKEYIKIKNFPYLKKIVNHTYFNQEIFRLSTNQNLNLYQNKKQNKNQLLKQSKQIYKHFIYFLKAISSTYLHWLSIMLHLRFKELEFYYFFSSVENIDFASLKNIIQQRKKFFILQTIYTRTNIILHYKLLLRKFFRLETRQSYYKTIQTYTSETAPPVEKKVPRGNQLTYFLIRRWAKIRRKRKISRLKPVHWAIPNYIHFDPSTLTTVLLYFPKTNEIHYSFRTFRCSLSKIISFYKSLGL